jgi:hypothetical protein
VKSNNCKVNEKDAPEGCIAVKATMLCGGCCMKKKMCLFEPTFNCCPSEREDGQIVIFKKEKKDV